jgi:uncharacterized membrane protein
MRRAAPRRRTASIAAVSVLVLAAVCATLALPGTAWAKSVSQPSFVSDVTVRPDGSLDIIEDMTFDFRDQWSGWEVIYRLEGSVDAGRPMLTADPDSVSVSEGGKAYKRVEWFGDYKRPFARPAGSYMIEPSTGFAPRLAVVWFYDAKDTTKTFRLKYRVSKGAVTAFDDVAQLYWKFVVDDRMAPIGNAKITIHLPPGASKDELKVWAHGPLTGVVTPVDGQTVTLEAPNVPQNRFVEGRILFPKRLVPKAATHPDAIQAKAVAEETRLAEEANAARLTARLKLWGGLALAFVALLAALAAWTFLFLRYGREYKPSFEGQYFRDMPSEDPPAVVGALYRMGDVTTDDFAATIMDLARRGFLRIEEQVVDKAGALGGILPGSTEKQQRVVWVKACDASCAAHESDLMDFLFYAIKGTQDSQGNVGVTMEAIRDWAKDHQTTFRERFAGWTKKVTEIAEARGFVESSSNKAVGLSVLVGVLLGLASFFFMTLHSVRVCGWAGIGVGVIMAVSSGVMKRRSRAANEAFAQWKALGQFLKDFSHLNEAPPQSLILWEKFLVYAVTLGVAKEVIEALKIVIPQIAGDAGYNTFAPWYVASGGFRDLDSFGSGLSDMSDGLTAGLSAAQVAATPESSGSGGGGGFSGGGGGGGGGGSSGGW